MDFSGPLVKLDRRGGFDEEKSDSIDMIISCLESIYDSSTVHNVSDYTNEEVRDFIQSLSVRDIQKIQTFFENIPKVKCKSNFLCPHCKAQNDTDIEGLSNFFWCVYRMIRSKTTTR